MSLSNLSLILWVAKQHGDCTRAIRNRDINSAQYLNHRLGGLAVTSLTCSLNLGTWTSPAMLPAITPAITVAIRHLVNGWWIAQSQSGDWLWWYTGITVWRICSKPDISRKVIIP